MKTVPSAVWKQALRSGLIAGGIAILVSLVGLVESFSDDDIITGLISLGDLFAWIIFFSYSSGKLRSIPGKPGWNDRTARPGSRGIAHLAGDRWQHDQHAGNVRQRLTSVVYLHGSLPLGADSVTGPHCGTISLGITLIRTIRKPITWASSLF
jgi:hypothetical protein